MVASASMIYVYGKENARLQRIEAKKYKKYRDMFDNKRACYTRYVLLQ